MADKPYFGWTRCLIHADNFRIFNPDMYSFQPGYLREEVRVWLEDNVGMQAPEINYGYQRNSHYAWVFVANYVRMIPDEIDHHYFLLRNQADAVKFKLVWG